MRVTTHRYAGPGGVHVSDVHAADLYLPSGPGPHPVVVLVHGGFWRAAYDRSLMVPLAVDLAARGYAAWNIEYCRLGQPGGGWPGTLEDVAASVDALADLPESLGLDLDRVVSVGHSAGGHLALWLAARPKLPKGAPGADPRVTMKAAVSQAGVADLESGRDLGQGAARELLGGAPEDVPGRYATASPAALLPLGVPLLCVHGDRDDRVPIEQSEKFVAAARAAGDDAQLATFPGMGHFEVIDPAHPSWRAVADWLDSHA